VSAPRTLQVLAIGPDPQLREEVEAALGGAGDARVLLRHVADFAEGVEAARARAPDLVLAELGSDGKRLRDFAEALRTLLPDVALIGLRPSAREEEADDGAVLVEALRARFEDVVPRPVSSTELRPWLAAAAARTGASTRREGLLIAFHSTKGGVGKSTLSVNVACALARLHPERVLLVDATLQLGVCASALDLAPRVTLADAARERQRLDPTLLRELAEPHPSGLRLLAAPRDPMEAADVDEESFARVLGVARRSFDRVIVDTLPVVDGLSLTALDLASRVYLVNQGTVPDVIGAARLLETLDRLGIDGERRRIVLNRNLARFPGALGAAEVAGRLEQPIAHEIPYDRRVLTGLNLGEPYVLRARVRWGLGGWARAIAGLVAEIESLAVQRAAEATQ
jgi:pilus assembly protein CpaE